MGSAGLDLDPQILGKFETRSPNISRCSMDFCFAVECVLCSACSDDQQAASVIGLVKLAHRIAGLFESQPPSRKASLREKRCERRDNFDLVRFTDSVALLSHLESEPGIQLDGGAKRVEFGQPPFSIMRSSFHNQQVKSRVQRDHQRVRKQFSLRGRVFEFRWFRSSR